MFKMCIRDSIIDPTTREKTTRERGRDSITKVKATDRQGVVLTTNNTPIRCSLHQQKRAPVGRSMTPPQGRAVTATTTTTTKYVKLENKIEFLSDLLPSEDVNILLPDLRKDLLQELSLIHI